MASGAIAALIAMLGLGFVEVLRNFYPSPETWARLRRSRGRRSLRTMRERFEAASERATPRRLAYVLLALVAAWVAAAGLLDKRWYEVVVDSSPYLFICAALWRTPGALHRVAQRMKEYERLSGDDPDAEEEEGEGPRSVAL